MDHRINGLWQAIFEYGPEGIFLVDQRGRIRAFNSAMERLTGWNREEILGKKGELILIGRRTDGAKKKVPPPARGGDPFRLAAGSAEIQENILLTRQGRMLPVTVSYSVIPAAATGSVYGIGIVKEITDGKVDKNTLRMEAITDGLTGLYNFRYFQNELDKEIKRAKRYFHPLSLIMIDIDSFKGYNDSRGHLEGNAVLKAVAGLLRVHTRETNGVARFGGDEFVILLPETDIRIATKAAVRIRRVIQARSVAFPGNQKGATVTVSLGVASFPQDASDAEGLIRCADEALFQAKGKGKNRVQRYGRFPWMAPSP